MHVDMGNRYSQDLAMDIISGGICLVVELLSDNKSINCFSFYVYCVSFARYVH